MNYDHLLSTIKISTMELKNRFYVPSMGTSRAGFDGSVTDCQVEYFRRKAIGGFGLVTCDYAFVSPEGQSIPMQLGIENDSRIEGLSKIAAAIHDGGAKASIQINHAGRSTMVGVIPFDKQPVAPSPLPCMMYKGIPRELTVEEIYELVELYGNAALRAKKAGSDAIELHMGHTYLIDQFISVWTNKRTDEFGGCLENRLRFAKLCIEDVKRKCGSDYPVLAKITGEDGQDGGMRILDTTTVVMLLEEYGLDAVCVSIGGYGRFDLINSANHFEPGFNLKNAERLKKAVSIPVIGIGRINDPVLAEMAIRTGMCDMVALGRQSLTDPDFPNKVMEGRTNEICACMGCNQACVGESADPDEAFGIGCMLNPFTAREWRMNLDPAPVAKKVCVVGAGPGGLEAAWVAAAKGHKVILFEKQDRAGGQYRIAGMPPFKQGVDKAIVYFKQQCSKYGVEIRYNTEATEEMILAERPDAVILATGGIPFVPPIPGIDDPAVLRAIDVDAGRVPVGDMVAILGGGLVGVETCDFISSDKDKHVSIIEMMSELGVGEHFSIQAQQYRRFRERGVDIHVSTKVISVAPGKVICENVKTKEQFEVTADTIINALGAVSYDPLASLEGKVPELYKIGDCRKAHEAKHAIFDGAAIACKL